MSIVLSILQILGWILLAVILILVIALLLILFTPACYLVQGEWLDEKWAKVKAHWLLRLIRAKISYGDDLIYGEVHIFWKKISFSFDFTKKKDDELEEEADELEDAAFGDFNETIQNPHDSAEKVIGTESAAELRNEPVQDSSEGNTIDSEASNEEEEILTEEQTESIVSKIKGIINRIKEVYPKIKKILTDEKNQDAVMHLKDEIFYFIKILLPKKSKVDAVFSTGAPDTTGQLFGVLACFPAMYQKDWKLMPDFESDEAYFKGTFWGKGRIYAYQILGIILRIVFDKNCRRLYTIISKFIKWLKKDDKSQEEK